MDAARKLALTSPVSSRSTTPLVMPDYSGADIFKLIKDDTSPYATIKSHTNISPNVTIVKLPDEKRSVLSPTISIIPPQSPVFERLQDEKTFQLKEEQDLINLESMHSSPVASQDKSETTSKSSSSNSPSHDRTILDITASTKITSVASPTKEALSINLEKSSDISSENESEPTKSDLEQREQPEDQKIKSRSPSPCSSHPELISPSKKLVSSMRLRFETNDKTIAEDDHVDKEGFSSEDSESKGSCDELNRILSGESIPDSKGWEDKNDETELDGAEIPLSDTINATEDEAVVTKQIFKTEEFAGETEDKEAISKEAKPELNDVLPTIIIEKGLSLTKVEEEVDDKKTPTLRPLTPQPLSPPSGSPSRATTPMGQRNIQRIQDNRKSQPKSGWL